MNYKALKKLCHIKHAWARTIHTFQVKKKQSKTKLSGGKTFSCFLHGKALNLRLKVSKQLKFLGCRLSISKFPVVGSYPFYFFIPWWRCSFAKAFLNAFQGSEEKTVVYVVGNPGRQHWQHVYTAVTRGRCRVYVIAEEMHLRKAITNNNFPRKTRLQRFLREAIANTNNCLPQTSSPLTTSWPGQEPGTQLVSLIRDVPDPPEPGTDRIQLKSSADLNEEHMGNSQQISPCKRQQSHTEDSEDVSISLLLKVFEVPILESLKQTLVLSLTAAISLDTVTMVLLFIISNMGRVICG